MKQLLSPLPDLPALCCLLQACVSAAVPQEYHDGCCNKHHSQRLQAEAEGKQYSKFDCSSLEEMACPDQDPILQVRQGRVCLHSCGVRAAED